MDAVEPSPDMDQTLGQTNNPEEIDTRLLHTDNESPAKTFKVRGWKKTQPTMNQKMEEKKETIQPIEIKSPKDRSTNESSQITSSKVTNQIRQQQNRRKERNYPVTAKIFIGHRAIRIKPTHKDVSLSEVIKNISAKCSNFTAIQPKSNKGFTIKTTDQATFHHILHYYEPPNEWGNTEIEEQRMEWPQLFIRTNTPQRTQEMFQRLKKCSKTEEISIIPIGQTDHNTSKFLITLSNKAKTQRLLQQKWINDDGVDIFFEQARKPMSSNLCRDCLGLHKHQSCGEKRCARCGANDHLIAQCKLVEYQRCINCNGNHHHFFRGCREFQGKSEQPKQSPNPEPHYWSKPVQRNPENWRGTNKQANSARSYATVTRTPPVGTPRRYEVESPNDKEEKLTKRIDQLEKEIQAIKTQQRANQVTMEAIQNNASATNAELMEQMRMINQALLQFNQGQQEMKEKIDQVSKPPSEPVPSPDVAKVPTRLTPLFKFPGKPQKKTLPRNKSAENLHAEWKAAQMAYESKTTHPPKLPKDRTPPTQMEKSPLHKQGRKIIEGSTKKTDTMERQTESNPAPTHTQTNITNQRPHRSIMAQPETLNYTSYQVEEAQFRNQFSPQTPSGHLQLQPILQTPRLAFNLDPEQTEQSEQSPPSTQTTPQTPRHSTTSRSAKKSLASGKQQPGIYQ